MKLKNEIMISNKIQPNLSIRGGAKVFFDYIKNIPENEILINFEGSQCISRSFAQEYLKQKRLINKEIVEINVPENINSILKLVENAPDPNVRKIVENL
jgi:hypothetical protein